MIHLCSQNELSVDLIAIYVVILGLALSLHVRIDRIRVCAAPNRKKASATVNQAKVELQIICLYMHIYITYILRYAILQVEYSVIPVTNGLFNEVKLG